MDSKVYRRFFIWFFVVLLPGIFCIATGITMSDVVSAMQTGLGKLIELSRTLSVSVLIPLIFLAFLSVVSYGIARAVYPFLRDMPEVVGIVSALVALFVFAQGPSFTNIWFAAVAALAGGAVLALQNARKHNGGYNPAYVRHVDLSAFRKPPIDEND